MRKSNYKFVLVAPGVEFDPIYRMKRWSGLNYLERKMKSWARLKKLELTQMKIEVYSKSSGSGNEIQWLKIEEVLCTDNVA